MQMILYVEFSFGLRGIGTKVRVQVKVVNQLVIRKSGNVRIELTDLVVKIMITSRKN